jgi:hypothetical protein
LLYSNERYGKPTITPSIVYGLAQREREEDEGDGGTEEDETDEIEVLCEAAGVEEAFLEGCLACVRSRIVRR